MWSGPGRRRRYAAASLACRMAVEEDEECGRVSMLQEFSLEEEPEAVAPRKARAEGKLINRQATVRYYNQMNPMKTYPLLVVISKKELEKIRQAHVDQKTGGSFKVEKDSVVEIEPILPGCNCYPPKREVRIGSE